MIEQPSFLHSGDAVHHLLLEMARQRTTSKLFDLVVTRLADVTNVSLARIWVLRPGDICERCSARAECQDRSNCLHLVASSGQSSINPLIQWNSVTGQYSRFPLGIRKVGSIAATGNPIVVPQINADSTWIANLDWARLESIQGFAGQPLVFQGKILGVLAVFTKNRLAREVLDVLRVVADHAAAALATALAFEEIEQLKNKLELENSFLREELFDIASFGGFVGQSRALRHVFDQIDVVAPTNATVLILGESGTGKELVAREIHHRSQRKNHPLIKVNCASIPNDLFESEFFGHVKGAFTGAIRDRIGRFATADGGTLFLDELGEIPLEHQSKLLRVLQEGEYERVGENRTYTTNARIIAATNKNLEKEVQAKRFREDLYFRLNVFPIQVPPLRERKDDIIPLANHFLKVALQDMNRPLKGFSDQQLKELQNYDWPGNVRELRNVIEQSAIYASSGPLRIFLPGAKGEKPEESMLNTSFPLGLNDTLHLPRPLSEREMFVLQRANIRLALMQCNWKIYGPDGAAALLGVKPTTLATRIKKMELSRPSIEG